MLSKRGFNREQEFGDVAVRNVEGLGAGGSTMRCGLGCDKLVV